MLRTAEEGKLRLPLCYPLFAAATMFATRPAPAGWRRAAFQALRLCSGKCGGNADSHQHGVCASPPPYLPGILTVSWGQNVGLFPVFWV